MHQQTTQIYWWFTTSESTDWEVNGSGWRESKRVLHSNKGDHWKKGTGTNREGERIR